LEAGLNSRLEELLSKKDAGLFQSDHAVSANLISLYKALGGGWETESKLADARQN
jgi:outer membrane protein TolC